MLTRLFASVFNRLSIPWQRRVLRVGVERFFVGVVGVCTDGERVLLARHRVGDPRWRLPGGYLEPNEAVVECLRREFREELGADVVVDGIIDVTAGYRYPRVEIVLRCHVDGALGRLSDELVEARYFGLDELPPLRIDQRRLIEGALGAAG